LIVFYHFCSITGSNRTSHSGGSRITLSTKRSDDFTGPQTLAVASVYKKPKQLIFPHKMSGAGTVNCQTRERSAKHDTEMNGCTTVTVGKGVSMTRKTEKVSCIVCWTFFWLHIFLAN